MLQRFKTLAGDFNADVSQAELRGLAKNTSDGAWLLLALAGLYMLTPGSEVLRPALTVTSFALFALFSAVLRFAPRFRRQTRRKISIELVGMVVFITVFLYSVETRASLLLVLYLLPVIICALTLGRWPTLVLTVLAITGFLLAALLRHSPALPEGREIVELGIALAPFLLVAYLTALLSHEIEMARQRIRTLSETDELTGLSNLRAFSRLHRQEHERALRHHRSYSVLVMDMNDLRKLNDTYGHEWGDRALVLFANVVRRLIRNTDAAARLGGDEFVVLLSESDAEHAERVMHRIRSATERSTIDVGGHMVRISVSVGAATFPTDADEPRELVATADQAMYQDKAGRKDLRAAGDMREARLV